MVGGDRRGRQRSLERRAQERRDRFLERLQPRGDFSEGCSCPARLVACEARPRPFPNAREVVEPPLAVRVELLVAALARRSSAVSRRRFLEKDVHNGGVGG